MDSPVTRVWRFCDIFSKKTIRWIIVFCLFKSFHNSCPVLEALYPQTERRLKNDLRLFSSSTPGLGSLRSAMEPPSRCLRVTRLALIHAVLAYISPEFTAMSYLPLALPTEIRIRILTHLHLTLSTFLLKSLRHSLQNALDDICDGCRVYNFHVYGK